jgi:hypothetical protein
MIQEFLAEQGPNRKPRLRSLIERLYEDDPKTLLAYAFGKPVESLNTTEVSEFVGLTNQQCEDLRALARRGAEIATLNHNGSAKREGGNRQTKTQQPPKQSAWD